MLNLVVSRLGRIQHYGAHSEGEEREETRETGKLKKVYGGGALKREGLSSKYGGCPAG